jgi:hypothetical protein
MGDHLCTCTSHSGAKNANCNWVVDQLTDLFRTTNHTKAQHITKSRGRHCGDIHLVTYLANTVGSVPLVSDLRNESATDKIRKFRADYNNNPPSAVSFIPTITSTSGRLHSKFIRLLFLQTHRETDHFLQFQEFSARIGSLSPVILLAKVLRTQVDMSRWSSVKLTWRFEHHKKARSRKS